MALEDRVAFVDGERFIEGLYEMEADGVIDAALWPVSEAERGLVDAILEGFRAQSGHDFAVLDVARRLGSGVSSYPILRFYVLIRTSEGALEILECKEIQNTWALPGLPALPPMRYAHNAERVVIAQRAVMGEERVDPWLGYGAVAAHSFRVQRRHAYQKGLRASRVEEKVAEGDWSVDDLEAFAQLAGAMLARAHTRHATRGGAKAGDAILGAIVDDDVTVQETVDFALRYSAQVEADWVRLRAIIDHFGPHLGYRP